MNAENRRSEPRTTVDRFYSMQFFNKNMSAVYQFRLWDVSPHGLCIIIENESEILPSLTVGDIFKVKYYPQELYAETTISKTEIRHITPGTQNRFKNHCLVGLKILE